MATRIPLDRIRNIGISAHIDSPRAQRAHFGSIPLIRVSLSHEVSRSGGARLIELVGRRVFVGGKTEKAAAFEMTFATD